MRVAAAIKGEYERALWLVEAGDFDTEGSIENHLDKYGNGYFGKLKFLGFLDVDLEENLDEVREMELIERKILKKGESICEALYKSQSRVVGHQQELAGRWLRCIVPIAADGVGGNYAGRS